MENKASGASGESSTAFDGVGIEPVKKGVDQCECSVCLGRYEDDLVDGILQKEWVCCTNSKKCGLWMHSDCLSTEGNDYVCFICNVPFK